MNTGPKGRELCRPTFACCACMQSPGGSVRNKWIEDLCAQVGCSSSAPAGNSHCLNFKIVQNEWVSKEL